MYCPKCGQQNDDSSRFCVKCSAQLPLSGGSLPFAQAQATATVIYAGFWKRFAAFILDYIIVVVLSMLAGGVIGFIQGAASNSSDEGLVVGLGAIAGVLVWWLYYAIMESSSKQATLGKIALAIRVVGGDGGRISFARATGRNFAKILSGMILMIGYLMAGFTAKKQALHDMVAGCLVVNRGAHEDQVQQGSPAPGMPVWAIVLIVLAACVVPLGIVAAVAIPAYQDMTIRARVSTAVAVGHEATKAVESFYARNKSLPRDLKEAGVPLPDYREIRGISMDVQTGAIAVVLATPPLEGKTIHFTPQRDSDNNIAWTCGSDDIRQQKYLPALCRK